MKPVARSKEKVKRPKKAAKRKRKQRPEKSDGS
jgi:hypothetical protein